MDSINLNTYSPFHKTGHTSKGNQRKWSVDNIWYKTDFMGYESLAEVLISRLLQKSRLQYPFVIYQPVQIEYKGALERGCSSQNFLNEHQTLIPLEKLFRQYTGESLAIRLSQFSEPIERIEYLVQQTEAITHLQNVGAYLTAMLEIDAFFLNEDRHTNNIAVIYDDQTKAYSFSPFFDQGLCLFADTLQDYPLDLLLEACLEKIEAKPFSSDFDEQLEAAEALYSIQIQFCFSQKDIARELDQIATLYPDKVRSRVEQLLRLQMRKYGYLMG